jgi:hypothetical protein
MIVLSLVFCEKDLEFWLSFVRETSRLICLLWLVSQTCILCETKFEF